jgi:microcystin-dependent protein
MKNRKKTISNMAVAGALALCGGVPVASAAFEPFIGEIMMVGYTFCPSGWAAADGQLLPISSNSALFSLYGTTYGGDGLTTFALPDLRGRVPMHTGNGPGLTPRQLGQKAGAETNTLTVFQLPAHSHSLNASSSGANQSSPANHVHANAGRTRIYSSGPADTVMSGGAIGNTGAGQAVNNMQPYTTIRFCVALQGVFPSRN